MSIKKFFKKVYSSREVSGYYDSWTKNYVEAGGEIIEAYRPSSDDELIEYYISTMGIEDGMSIVDAGCGLAVPAMEIARRKQVQIHAVTNSKVQFDAARERLEKETLKGSVALYHADYNTMASVLPANSFDLVYFLESFGHSPDPAVTLQQVSGLLKEGGQVFIKDFFLKYSKDPKVQTAIDFVADRVSENYYYNIPEIGKTVALLAKNEFTIEQMQPPQFTPDASIRIKFESDNQVDNYGKYGVMDFSQWYEIKATLNPHIYIPGFSS